MITSEGTEALIALEDAEPAILFEPLPGTDVAAWPLMRWLVARATAETELKTVVVPKAISRQQTLARGLNRVMPNPHSASRISKRAAALFIVAGGTQSQTPLGVRNWLVDYAAAALGDEAVVVQDAPIPRSAPQNERPILRNTYSFEDSMVDVEIAAKFAPPRKGDLDSARALVRGVFEQLDFDVSAELIASVERRFVLRFRRARHTLRHFESLLDRVDPEIIFMQTAAYGDRSHLINAAKRRGIAVAEHQHGWIGPSHAAYNYGKAMSNPKLRDYMPDTLLTFGEFWSEQVRFPGRKIAVGKPHLDKLTAHVMPVGLRDKVVLVASSVLEPEEMARFTLSVRDALPADWRILFRPHPSERSSLHARYPLLVNAERVEFDRSLDVYESLASVRAVFGVASTVLYEALAFDCPVYVKQSRLSDLYIDDILGARVETAEDLARAVADISNAESADAFGVDRSRMERVWKPHPTASFKAFANQAITRARLSGSESP